MDLNKIMNNAKRGKFGLWKLNFLLWRYIPFNRPHRIKIITFEEDRLVVALPYIKNNKNHIKGLHACGMATAAEFSSGFLLLNKLGFKKYRLIMESIQVEYYYQGKTDAKAVFELSDEELENKITYPLQNQDKISYRCSVNIVDVQNNHLCTATMKWQIKKWEKVRMGL